MRIEFYRKDDPGRVVGTAIWDGRRAQLEAEEETIRASLDRIFLPTPVVVEDGAFRYLGASGEAVIQPGSLEWFREAAFARSESEGLAVRVVPELAGEGGWDPAAAYRTFRESMRRRFEEAQEAAAASRPQPGEKEPAERAATGDQPRGSAGPPTGP
jgi:hypothetical protein